VITTLSHKRDLVCIQCDPQSTAWSYKHVNRNHGDTLGLVVYSLHLAKHDKTKLTTTHNHTEFLKHPWYAKTLQYILCQHKKDLPTHLAVESTSS